MKKIEVSFLAILLTFPAQLSNSVCGQDLLVFPVADGFGKFTSRARNGLVIFATNLNDSKSGNLHNAIDNDGMPNDWELEYGLNPNYNDSLNNILNLNGYTALEVYINSIKEFKDFIKSHFTIKKTTEAKSSEADTYPNPLIDQASISNLVDDCNAAIDICDVEEKHINNIINNQQFNKELKQIIFKVQNQKCIK